MNKDSKEITKPKAKRKRVVKKVNEVLEKTNEHDANDGNKKKKLDNKTSKSGWWSRKSS